MIAVVGPHRSGTSFVSNLLMELGVPFGNPKSFLLADGSNSSGYYEQTEVLDLNSRILSGWPYTPGGWRCRIGQMIYVARPTQRAILRRFHMHRLEVQRVSAKNTGIAVKDPRFCLLWRLWHSARPFEGVVLCLRHPIETALSLRRRKKLPIVIGLRFWDWHVENVLNGLTELPTRLGCLWLDYNRLAGIDPDREFESIARFFRLSMPMERFHEVHTRIFNPRLHHFSVTGTAQLPPRTRQLWHELCHQRDRAEARSRSIQHPHCCPMLTAKNRFRAYGAGPHQQSADTDEHRVRRLDAGPGLLRVSGAGGGGGNRRHLAGLILCILVVLLLAVFLTNYSDSKLLVERSAPWGPVFYVLIKALFYIAAPLSSLPLQVAAGTIFGLWQAALYTLLGSMIGGSINFALSRLLGRPVISKMRGGRIVSRLDDLAARYATVPDLLVARVFFSPIYDLISYAVGLTRVPFRVYFVVSLVGGIVPSLVWAAFGASLGSGVFSVLAASIGLSLFLLVSFYVRRKRL